MKILLNIPLSPFSGYGNDGIGLARALMRWGADVYVNPTIVQPPLPEDVALLLTKRLEKPFDLIINHVDPGALETSTEQKDAATWVVGWTMWEYTNLKNLPGRSKFPKRVKKFDALIAYDEVSQEALQTAYSGPVPILQGGFEPDQWPKVERDWFSDRFGFCMVGQLHERKDPFVAIQAFQELKNEKGDAFAGAELHLKTNIPGLHSAMENTIPKLRIHYDVWPDHILRKFYASQHMLLAPSRGEGKNMPALEFQSTGGVVAATDWGGHRQWMHSDYAYPIEKSLAPVSPEFPDTFNARASVESLKEIMWDAYTNRGKVRQMGDTAARIIPAMCSWDAVVKNLFDRLSNTLPNGQRLRQLAEDCHTGLDEDE